MAYNGIQEIESDQVLDIKISSKFKKWIKKIESNVDKNFVNHALNDSSEETDAQRNPYVAQQIIKTMSQIFAKIALFSNVMNPVFKTTIMNPSTSGTEAQFRNLKSYVFQSMKNIRLDTWLERSIEVTKGIFKAMSADLKEAKKTEAPSNDEELNDDHTHIKEENWKNQNVDAKKEKRKHRNPQSVLNPEKGDVISIPLLPNGGLSKKLDGVPYKIFSTQTCAADVFLHLFASLYADSRIFKDEIDRDKSLFTEFIRLFMSPGAAKQKDQINAHRNQLLLELFPQTVIDIKGLKSIDCETTIRDMYERICRNCSFFYSIQIWPDCCMACVEKEFVKFTLRNFDVKNVQKSIHAIKYKYRCNDCQKQTDVEQQPQMIVAFDTENADRDVSLNDIQRTIKIGNFTYFLLGAIEHRPSNKHFVAHALRSTSNGAFQWVEYDDLKYRAETHDDFVAARIVMILYSLEHGRQPIQRQIEQGDNNKNKVESPSKRKSKRKKQYPLAIMQLRVRKEEKLSYRKEEKLKLRSTMKMI